MKNRPYEQYQVTTVIPRPINSNFEDSFEIQALTASDINLSSVQQNHTHNNHQVVPISFSISKQSSVSLQKLSESHSTEKFILWSLYKYWILLALNIYIFTFSLFMIRHTQPLFSSHTIQAKQVIQSVSEIMNSQIITDMVLAQGGECPKNYKLIPLTTWPGSIQGCLYREGNLSWIEEGSCSCDDDQICEEIPASSKKKTFTNWGTGSLCGARSEDFRLSSGSCPTGFRKCAKNHYCMTEGEECGVSVLQYKRLQGNPHIEKERIKKLSHTGEHFEVIWTDEEEPIVGFAITNDGPPCLNMQAMTIHEDDIDLLNYQWKECDYFGYNYDSKLVASISKRMIFNSNNMVNNKLNYYYLDEDNVMLEKKFQIYTLHKFRLKEKPICLEEFHFMDIFNLSLYFANNAYHDYYYAPYIIFFYSLGTLVVLFSELRKVCCLKKREKRELRRLRRFKAIGVTKWKLEGKPNRKNIYHLINTFLLLPIGFFYIIFYSRVMNLPQLSSAFSNTSFIDFINEGCFNNININLAYQLIRTNILSKIGDFWQYFLYIAYGILINIGLLIIDMVLWPNSPSKLTR